MLGQSIALVAAEFSSGPALKAGEHPFLDKCRPAETAQWQKHRPDERLPRERTECAEAVASPCRLQSVDNMIRLSSSKGYQTICKCVSALALQNQSSSFNMALTG